MLAEAERNRQRLQASVSCILRLRCWSQPDVLTANSAIVAPGLHTGLQELCSALSMGSRVVQGHQAQPVPSDLCRCCCRMAQGRAMVQHPAMGPTSRPT